MITTATRLTPGTPVEFPSPRSGREVTGRVRSDRGTYASVEWDEDGAGLATCMYKGLITCPGLADAATDRPTAPVEFRQLALFGDEAAPVPAEKSAGPAAAALTAAERQSAAEESARFGDGQEQARDACAPRGLRLAEIRWQGRRTCCLRDVTGLAVASWRRAGFEVIDLSERLEKQ